MQFVTLHERPPWIGGHLQTIRNTVRSQHIPLDDVSTATAHTVPTLDGTGDSLTATLHEPIGTPPNGPTAVLLHGLGGSQDSVYVRLVARALVAGGSAVLRADLRGAGVSADLCRFQYHSGKTGDIRSFLRWLCITRPDLTGSGIAIVGFSLGANATLKLLGEGTDDYPVVVGAAVSAPLDLAAGSAHIHRLRNRLYEQALLSGIKRQALRPSAAIDATTRRAVGATRSIREFDEVLVAPQNGFRGADDYYAQNSALSFLEDVPVPTLVIHALDDPMIPNAEYLRYAWEVNPSLVPVLTDRGGHVGFHRLGDRTPWYVPVVTRFILAAGGPDDASEKVARSWTAKPVA